MVRRLLRRARRLVLVVPRFFRFLISFGRFTRRQAAERPDARARLREIVPCLADSTATTGYDRHYVLHTAWAARILRRISPSEHVDISSSLYFVAIASAFVPIRFYDLRPAALGLENCDSGVADIQRLPFSDRSVESLSCMHVIEHIGLGRYGDPLDPNGDTKAIAELRRVVKPGGNLLIVVPVGRQRVQFNAHRVYAPDAVPRFFQDCRLAEFAVIPDDPRLGTLLRDADPEAYRDADYACGCYWFVKR